MTNGRDGKPVTTGSNANVHSELFRLFHGSICNYNCTLKGSRTSGEKRNL